MGAYCPARVLGPADERSVVDEVLLTTVRGMAEEGTPLRGVLYAGIMLTRDGPKVLDYNCRFGGPEAQVILPLLDDDGAELMLATIAGSPAGAATQAAQAAGALPLAGRRLAVSDGACACVVMAPSGCGGTRLGGRSGRHVVTAGGRVLNVTAKAPALSGTVKEVYRALTLIRSEPSSTGPDRSRPLLPHVGTVGVGAFRSRPGSLAENGWVEPGGKRVLIWKRRKGLTQR